MVYFLTYFKRVQLYWHLQVAVRDGILERNLHVNYNWNICPLDRSSSKSYGSYCVDQFRSKLLEIKMHLILCKHLINHVLWIYVFSHISVLHPYSLIPRHNNASYTCSFKLLYKLLKDFDINYRGMLWLDMVCKYISLDEACT